ncbi:MAG: hypothetical protein AB8B52_09670 [Winogradskyella sp.]|uniref:hypothetical protein n=1 Tax=Winogradskyella sp. TaxID=1883156 RepID=UPI00385D965F
MKTIKILMLCLLTTLGYAQKKMTKTSQSIKVNKDVVVDLNTSYVEIEIDTWNKNEVSVEAYIEGEKLSEAELKKALDNWNLKVDGSSDRVTISSVGSDYGSFFVGDDFSGVIKDLEYHLADLPEVPRMPDVMVLPMMPNMSKFPMLPEMPEKPVMPKLPELPKGVTTIDFDYNQYKEEGEAYLKEWSKKYEKKGGKEFQKNMEDWARKFAESGYQEKMTKWGEEYGKRFEGKWAKDMAKWGVEFGEKFDEKYAKDLEKWGEEFGKEWAEKMEAWGKEFEAQMELKSDLLEEHQKEQAFYKRDQERLKRMAALENRKAARSEAVMKKNEERKMALEKRRDRLINQNTSQSNRFFEIGNNNKVRKVIKIKIPKKAKLKTNIRHGELKLTSLIHNMEGDISHSFLVAEHIDGTNTSINVSYSPVMINTWNLGTLNLNFVDKAQIKTAQNLVLNSKSSNITLGNLNDTAIIDGSFGDLTISNLAETFKNLNLVLENSDALINLPKDVDYTLYFKGNRSKFNNKATTQKTIRNYPEGESSNRNIIVNAKFSSVIID